MSNSFRPPRAPSSRVEPQYGATQPRVVSTLVLDCLMMIQTSQAVVAELKGRITGDILQPGDAEFDAARRIWNGTVERTPGAIVRCGSVADVQATVLASSRMG